MTAAQHNSNIFLLQADSEEIHGALSQTLYFIPVISS
jgi:hypothetical protein